MRAIIVSGKNRARSWKTGLRRHVILAALTGGTVMFGVGCDTPYTRRIKQLDDTYQQGYLTREDYMRFAHDIESWERR